MLAVMIDGRSVGTVSLTVKEVIARSIGTVTSSMILIFGFRKRLVETMLTEGSLNLPSVAAFGKIGSRSYAALLLRVVWSMVSRGPCYFPGHRIVARRGWLDRMTSLEERLLRWSSGTIASFDRQLVPVIGHTSCLLMTAMEGALCLHFLVNRFLELRFNTFANVARLCNVFTEPFVDGHRTGAVKVGIQRRSVIGLVHDRDYRFVYCCNRDFVKCLVRG